MYWFCFQKPIIYSRFYNKIIEGHYFAFNIGILYIITIYDIFKPKYYIFYVYLCAFLTSIHQSSIINSSLYLFSLYNRAISLE